MEKVLYCLSGLDDIEALGPRWGEVTADLVAAGAHDVQINVADDDVAAGRGRRMAASAHPAEAVVSVWLDSAIDARRRPIDEVLAGIGGELAAYLVTESVPMRNTRHAVAPGTRTPGMAHLAFFRRPADQPVDEWLDIWLNSHTQIAIDTQDTFGYVQNVVTRVLTDGATPWHAIVEELFPPEAMADQAAFFDAVGDPERQADHERIMFESVQRFIDLSSIDVIPTSQYRMA